MTARIRISGRSLAFFAILAALAGLFAFVAVKTGPFATVAVTVATVAERSVTPSIFGIGTVEARRRYTIGPIVTGRLLRLDVNIGDRVREGQTLGEIDPVAGEGFPELSDHHGIFFQRPGGRVFCRGRGRVGAIVARNDLFCARRIQGGFCDGTGVFLVGADESQNVRTLQLHR